MIRLTRRQAAAGLALSGLFASGLAARAQGADPMTPLGSLAWAPAAPLPWTAQEIYPCAFRGGILVAGGLRGTPDGFEGISRVAHYDPAADSWTETTPLPDPRHHGILVPLENEVLIIGGFIPRGAAFWTNVASVLRYDPERGSAEDAPLPRPQSEAVAAMLADGVHLVTGRTPKGVTNAVWDDQGDIADHWVRDPADGRWREARPAPTARNSAAGAVLNGALHVVGGRMVGGGNLATHERYDPAEDRWDTLAPMPQAQGGLAAGLLGERIYAFGGEYGGPDGAGVFPECWEYDVHADAWTAAPDMPTPRHGLGGVSLGGQLYSVAGARGYSGSQTSGVLEALGPA